MSDGPSSRYLTIPRSRLQVDDARYHWAQHSRTIAEPLHIVTSGEVNNHTVDLYGAVNMASSTPAASQSANPYEHYDAPIVEDDIIDADDGVS
jgi:hypothetical protein